MALINDFRFKPLTQVKPVKEHAGSVAHSPQEDPQALHIYQRGFAVIDRHAAISKLGIANHHSTLAVIGHHPLKHVLFVAHFDTTSKVNPSLQSIFGWLRHAGLQSDDIADLNVWFDSVSHLHNLTKAVITTQLHDMGVINIEDLSINNLLNANKRFIISVHDGQMVHGVIPKFPEADLTRVPKEKRAGIIIESPLEADYIDIKGVRLGL